MKNEPHFRMVLGSSRHLGILYFQSAPGPHLRWRSGLRQQLSPPLWPWVNNVSTHGRLLRWGGFLSNLWSFDADFLVVLGTVQNPSFCVSSDVVSRLQYSLDGDVGAADSGLDQPHAASDGLTGSLRKRFLGKWISRPRRWLVNGDCWRKRMRIIYAHMRMVRQWTVSNFRTKQRRCLCKPRRTLLSSLPSAWIKCSKTSLPMFAENVQASIPACRAQLPPASVYGPCR